MTDKRVVLVTCKSTREARKIGRKLVESRLAACANLVRAPVESIYRWKGSVETAREVLLIFKTTQANMRRLEKAIREAHSYEVPEIVALPIAEGLPAYLDWIADSAPEKATKERKSK
ncbi:MAG TPA: divalent-cation tolerance protein CutA [Candidatus Acidoferrum sp.]|nr:divalent-cation tolerance protein CutA [Candidatus Acidoferrum sp.]